MVVLEYRIPLPVSVEEFKVAQLYMVMKASEENTGGGEGVEVMENEPYDNTDGQMDKKTLSGCEIPKNKGQYTLKKYFLGSRVPGYVKATVPTDALFLYEEAWNAYPHCKTVLTNGYLSVEKFSIEIETWHEPDRGTNEKCADFSADHMKNRLVRPIDISADIVKSKLITKEEYEEKYDPAKFKSEKTGRGELTEGWQETTEPIMCAYKIVRANFKYFGLQSKVESLIENFETKLFTTTLRQAFCLIDEWHGLNMDDIRRMEQETAKRLDDQRANDEAAKSKLSA